jgi:serine/threonine-protein kinase
MIAKLRPWPALALCCVGVCLPVKARAEAGAAQKAAAESLFDDGLKAMKSGHFSEACPKLEESERIDPAIGTLLYLGECYEKIGRSASAWATFREAASAAQAQGETERTRVAAQRADRLQPSLSKLTLKVVPETAQLASLRVTRDGVALAKTLFGVAIPVDPGKYHIVVSADGYQNHEAEIEVLANGDSKTLEIPVLTPSATVPPAAAGAVAATANPAGTNTQAAAAAAPANPEHAASSGGNGLRTAAYVSGALGVVSLGIGTYFGVKAISKNNDAKDHCPAGNTCNDHEGEVLTNDAQSAATVSNITIAVGAVFVAAGVVLYLTSAPKAKAESSARLEMHPLVSRDLAGIGFGGAFQ